MSSQRAKQPSESQRAIAGGVPAYRSRAEHIAYLLRHSAIGAKVVTCTGPAEVVQVDWPEHYQRTDAPHRGEPMRQLAGHIEAAIYIALRSDRQRADVVYALSGGSQLAAWVIVQPATGEHRQAMRFRSPAVAEEIVTAVGLIMHGAPARRLED